MIYIASTDVSFTKVQDQGNEVVVRKWIKDKIISQKNEFKTEIVTSTKQVNSIKAEVKLRRMCVDFFVPCNRFKLSQLWSKISFQNKVNTFQGPRINYYLTIVVVKYGVAFLNLNPSSA